MKHSIPSALFFLLATSSLPAAAAPLQEGTGLAEIRKTFVAADRNADGSLDPAEAKRATIPSADFLNQDHDNDRKLSEDEFLLYYRQLLIGAKQKVAADVEREADRITKARAKQAAEAEARRKAEAARKAEQKSSPVVLSKNVSEKLKRAESALDAMVARGDLTPAEADAKREVLRQRAEAVSGRSRARAQDAKPGADGEVDVEKRFRRAEDSLRKASSEGKLSRVDGQEQRNKLAERARNAQADANRTERDKLAAELKQLDVDLAAGRLTKADYESQRTALIERGKRAEKVGGAQDSQNGDARARGEAARKQHQEKQAQAEKDQQQRERGEAARRQHQDAEKQRAERERLQREKQAAEKQRAERERLQRQKEAAAKQEAEKQRKDAERRKRAQQDAERKRKEREDASRKQP
jgi:hypothetical protein